jgi:hypothetical protein
VDTATLLMLGAAGGAVRGIMHAYDCMTEWLDGRQQYRHAPDPGADGPPAFSAFYDVGGESIAAAVHAVLGALVAGLLGTSGQVSGGFAVFAAGAAAPLILVQLKNSRLAEVIIGEGASPSPAGATQPADAASNASAPVPGNTQGIVPEQPSGTSERVPPLARRPPSSSSSSLPGREGLPTTDQDGTE